jgi:DNA-binding phage protein
VRELREAPDFAAEYLKAALEDTDEPHVLLVALSARGANRKAARAEVAKAAGLKRTKPLPCPFPSRQSTSLSTLRAVLKAVGLKLTVEPSS